MLNSPSQAIRSGARSFERALFLVAFLALAYVSWIEFDRLSYQRIESARLSSVAKNAVSQGLAPASRKRKPPVASEVIGRLTIPAAEIDAIVAEGVDDPTLNRAIGHIPNTALPGESGNVALAGHRDTFFRGLAKLKLADPIQLVTADGTYDYRVEDLRIVEPTEVGVLDPGSSPTLTLVTCYPFHYIGAAPQRYIVRAREVRRPAAVRRAPLAPLAPNTDLDRL